MKKMIIGLMMGALVMAPPAVILANQDGSEGGEEEQLITTSTVVDTEKATTTVTVEEDDDQPTTTHKPTTTVKDEDDQPTTTYKPRVTTTVEDDDDDNTTTTHKPRVTTTTAPDDDDDDGTTTTHKPTTTTTTVTTTTVKEHKWFVCKYVGTPGVDERLQTGDNPISVDGHSIATFPNIVIGAFFADAQGRSVVIAQDTGQPEPDADDCPPGSGGTTTTSTSTTSTTSTSTTSSTTSTTLPPPTLFALTVVVGVCPPSGVPSISITFPSRPDLDGQTGTLSFSTGAPSVPLVFQSNATVLVPWPAGDGNIGLLTYTLGAESATAGPVIFPEGCVAITTTTTIPPSTTSTTGPTTTTSTTIPGNTTTTTTTTSIPGSTTTTTLPAGQPFSFGAASTVCVAEVPTIRITFVTPAQFPSLVGQTGTLTMNAVNGGALLSTQPLVYQPGTTVDILYPGTRVNPDGTIADVPGWILQPNGLWVLDPTDQFLRDGIRLTYVVNPTATAVVSYPPESATCANPENPTTPGRIPPGPGTPPGGGLPSTGSDVLNLFTIGVLLALGGLGLRETGRRRRRDA